MAKQRQATVDAVQAQIAEKEPNVEPLHVLPPAGLDVDSVMTELEERAANDFRYADGESKTTGTIYMSGDNHRDLLNDAYCMFSQANPIHADLFPSVRRMEAEVVAMTADLLGGGRSGVPTVRFERSAISATNWLCVHAARATDCWHLLARCNRITGFTRSYTDALSLQPPGRCVVLIVAVCRCAEP